VHDDTARSVHDLLRVEWMDKRAHAATAAGIAEELQFRRRSVEVDAIGTNAEGLLAASASR